jgi:hypothetical protein
MNGDQKSAVLGRLIDEQMTGRLDRQSQNGDRQIAARAASRSRPNYLQAVGAALV